MCGDSSCIGFFDISCEKADRQTPLSRGHPTYVTATDVGNDAKLTLATRKRVNLNKHKNDI